MVHTHISYANATSFCAPKLLPDNMMMCIDFLECYKFVSGVGGFCMTTNGPTREYFGKEASHTILCVVKFY